MIEILYRLRAYVPFLQTCLWIIFFLLLLLIFGSTIFKVIDCIIKKINRGAGLKLFGIEFLPEEVKKIPQVNYKLNHSLSNVFNITSSKNVNIEDDFYNLENKRVSIYEENHGIFLTHVLDPNITDDGYQNIYIYLIEHENKDFSSIYSRIEYASFFFGHMWNNKVFTIKNQMKVIGIQTMAYSPFLCLCKVKFFNDNKEVLLERYIDFEINKLFVNDSRKYCKNTIQKDGIN